MPLIRLVYLAIGCVMVALGIIGAFLPVMPTTIFLILAAWCFARSSPRLERWLLDHAHFGPTLRRWRESGAISPRAKASACGGMALGFVIFLATAKVGAVAIAVVAAVMLGSAAYVLSRPNGGPS